MTKYLDKSSGRLIFLTSDITAGKNIDVKGRIYNFISNGNNYFDPGTGVFITASAGASYLLDTYPAFAAYSTRQLSSTATNCMRIREGGTNTETDVGFVDGWLDESAVATHCGAADGFVTTWYDQSGNSYDATQAAVGEQLLIYSAGVVTTLNSKPALSNFNRLFADGYKTGTITYSNATQPDTIFCVGQLENNDYLYDSESASPRRLFRDFNNAILVNSGATINTGSDQNGQKLFTTLSNGASSVIRANGTQIGAGNLGTNNKPAAFILGNSYQVGQPSSRYMQEWIFMDGDQTANFAAIESDINTAFGVY